VGERLRNVQQHEKKIYQILLSSRIKDDCLCCVFLLAFALPLPSTLSVPLSHRGSFAEHFSFLSSKASPVLRDFSFLQLWLIVSYRLQCRLAFKAIVGIHSFPFRAWLGRLITIDTAVQVVPVPVLYSGPGFVHSYPTLSQGMEKGGGPMTLQARVGAARQKC
jgi:hypothetical protein